MKDYIFLEFEIISSLWKKYIYYILTKFENILFNEFQKIFIL